MLPPEKWEAHIARQKQNIEGLIQITRAHYTNGKGEEPILTHNEYTVIDPEKQKGAEGAETASCTKATSAIIMENSGKRGEILRVCTDTECPVHGKPSHDRAEQEAVAQQRRRVETTTARVREKPADKSLAAGRSP